MSVSSERVFRMAEANDIPQLVELINYAYRDPSLVNNWKSEAALLAGQRTDAQHLSQLITRQNSALLVMSPAKTSILLGCVHLELNLGFAYLGMLTIHANHQNQGLAKELLRAAEQFVKEVWKRPLMKMTVIGQRKELIQYYRRCGYNLTGEVEPFPYEDKTFGHPKRDDLYFEVLSKDLSPEARI